MLTRSSLGGLIGGLQLWNADTAVSFCVRWLKKASRYDDKSLAGAFDRFFSLFVAFNRLYCELAAQSGGPHKGDHCEATCLFAQIVDPEALSMAFGSREAEDDIRTLADLIAPDGGFYVATRRKDGDQDCTANRELYGQLISIDPSSRMAGLLEYLYQVRCNTFHGRKSFEPNQLQILQPASRCLERIIRVGLTRLRAEPD